MVIFHSYVSLPEGTNLYLYICYLNQFIQMMTTFCFGKFMYFAASDEVMNPGCVVEEGLEEIQ